MPSSAGLDAADLAALGRTHDRPEWVAAAQVLEEYDEVTALASPGAYDPALIVGAATRALDDDDLLADVRRCARFVAVDDAQEMTPAVAELLAAVVGRGGELLLAGDPDAATLGFRGADPAYLAERADEFAAPVRRRSTTPTIVLRTCWRHGPEIRAAVERVVTRVGTGGRGGQRRATPAPGLEPGQVGVHLLRSGVQEASYIAGVLRRAHLQRELPWGEMAVIVRGSGRVATMRRVLSGAGVPVQVPATEVPVRDESAVAPLLDAFEVALELSAIDARPDPADPDGVDSDGVDSEGVDSSGVVADEPMLDPARAVGLLTSPIGGADAVALRRLRRALRAEERAGGGGRASGRPPGRGDPGRGPGRDAARRGLPARSSGGAGARRRPRGRRPGRRRGRRGHVRGRGHGRDRALGDLGRLPVGRALAAYGARRRPVGSAGRSRPGRGRRAL